ncbi:M24 family metallopeptidase [Caldisalinibacter kiritimatiensis]|uniref:Aminopeptidase YpdF (MP-, MA-, MS-, AP-, NP-specific) n=1 Tax=Caldisalinibacter kiritimatiensis TaxID=1304284 RepID=R1ARH9_9FIRM|nr:Xaa-Pro peptidase family protein [Caldisalinibacter kiritimatiensis]EOC99757.1 Aminopeptidase YpdF (MP-, MA-, MS-, AP-, NP- specific) [Caldisalinibacter kiritimatiensis]
MNNRIEKLRKKMEELNCDWTLIFKPENRRYFSGFTGTTGYVLISNNNQMFATDFRYTEQAETQCKGYEIKEINKQKNIFSLLKELKIERLGIEDEFITYQFVNNIKEKVGDIKLVPLKGALNDIRMIKDSQEIEYIQKAAEITDKALEYMLKQIKVGMTEREVAVELEYQMKKLGAEGPSFEFIVASGKRSSMPHGVASDKVIEAGDLVTIDMGCIYKGYCSDMTRTFVMGKANEEQEKIYNIVLNAQEEVLKSIKPGKTGFELDKIARDIITNEGYGPRFGHSLGHGVGLEVHEQPYLVQHEMGKIELKPGMVITDEPGIYIPGFGGVRIEDLVVVTEDGCKVLSKSTKQLIEVNN